MNGAPRKLAARATSPAATSARADHRQGMRVEGEHGVGVVDNRPVAEVHAVEGPDGDPPPAVGTRLDLAQRYDPHDASTTYGFSWPSSVERAMARSRSLRVIL